MFSRLAWLRRSCFDEVDLDLLLPSDLASPASSPRDEGLGSSEIAPLWFSTAALEYSCLSSTSIGCLGIFGVWNASIGRSAPSWWSCSPKVGALDLSTDLWPRSGDPTSDSGRRRRFEGLGSGTCSWIVWRGVLGEERPRSFCSSIRRGPKMERCGCSETSCVDSGTRASRFCWR